MFEKYDLEAQKIINLAESIAFNYDSGVIEVLHLLLAFLKIIDTPLALELKKYGVNAKIIEKEIKITSKKCQSNNSNFFMEYSKELKDIFAGATKMSEEKSEEKVTTLNLTLSLIQSNSPTISSMLDRFDISLPLLKESILSYYQKHNDLDNLSDLHRLGENLKDPLIGREKEVSELIQALKRRNKPNAILVGEPGVGKTHIVEYVANKLYNNEIPGLENYSIFELDLASSVSGTKYRGEFEEKIKKIIKKVKENKRTILFIDEIHNIVKAGGAEGAIDCSNILKPYLSRGEIRIIGATTEDEFENIFSIDKALKRRFQKIIVQDNSKEETILILEQIKHIYESYYNKNIDNSLLPFIVNLAAKYCLNEHFPDKAIDILDNSTVREQTSELTKETIIKTMEELYKIKISFKSEIDEVITKINDEVVGQELALDCLKKDLIIMENKVSQNRPQSVILFVGPSGVGKTMTATLLARHYFHNEDSLIKINLSTFDSSSISRLVGSSPGYEGHNLTTNFVKSLKKNPHSLILLDEIDKANDQVLNFFMSMFDEGFFYDSKGNKIDITNAVFILTSNYGFDQSTLFQSNISSTKINKSLLMKKLNNKFRFEFLSRIDDIIIFNEIEQDNVYKITNNLLKSYNMNLECAKDILIDYDENKNEIKRYGARAIRKIVTKKVLEGQK